MAAKTQPESLIRRSILEFLSIRFPRGKFWINRNSPSFDKRRGVFIKPKGDYEIKGVSDILGMLDGYFIALEVKTPSNKKRDPNQTAFIELVQSHGHIAGYVTSIEDAERVIIHGIEKSKIGK